MSDPSQNLSPQPITGLKGKQGIDYQRAYKALVSGYVRTFVERTDLNGKRNRSDSEAHDEEKNV